MAVVNQEVAGEGFGREVVDAAGAVGGLGEDDDVSVGGGEGADDVGDGEGVHEEAIGELEGDEGGGGGVDAVEGLVDLKGVVGREEGDGGVEGRVGEEGGGDLGFDEALGLRFRIRVCES